MKDVIHWITEHKEESSPNGKVSHSHPDPTANEAIGNVVREERRKKHQKRKHPKRECQTNARLWRQGQTDVVTIHHIITKDTVDEDVMAALEQKDMTQEKLISAVKAQLGR